MLINRNILKIMPLLLIFTIMLTFPLMQIHATENVKWKTFKEKNGLFTIKYPSNWTPIKLNTKETEEYYPINMVFGYYKGNSIAGLTMLAGESIFYNATDMVDSYETTVQNYKKYELIQPTQCGKYIIKGVSACDTLSTYKDPLSPKKSIVNDLLIGIIDDEGVEYVMEYKATKDVFDDFLPVVEEMVKSFNVTGDILSSGEESIGGTDDSPDLPPLTESPTLKL